MPNQREIDEAIKLVEECLEHGVHGDEVEERLEQVLEYLGKPTND